MSRPLIVIRPEPGASATAARALAVGIDARVHPLFAIRPLAWRPPPPRDFDMLLLTSANAVRTAGPALDDYAALPVHAVGAATARAAAAAGLRVIATGARDVDRLLSAIPAEARVLWLCGKERIPLRHRATITPVTVYRAVAIEASAAMSVVLAQSCVVALHSARAARLLGQIVHDRRLIDAVAISASVAHAAGSGWRTVNTALQPTDAALLALVRTMCDKPTI